MEATSRAGATALRQKLTGCEIPVAKKKAGGPPAVSWKDLEISCQKLDKAEIRIESLDLSYMEADDISVVDTPEEGPSPRGAAPSGHGDRNCGRLLPEAGMGIGHIESALPSFTTVRHPRVVSVPGAPSFVVEYNYGAAAAPGGTRTRAAQEITPAYCAPPTFSNGVTRVSTTGGAFSQGQHHHQKQQMQMLHGHSPRTWHLQAPSPPIVVAPAAAAAASRPEVGYSFAAPEVAYSFTGPEVTYSFAASPEAPPRYAVSAKVPGETSGRGDLMLAAPPAGHSGVSLLRRNGSAGRHGGASSQLPLTSPTSACAPAAPAHRGTAGSPTYSVGSSGTLLALDSLNSSISLASTSSLSSTGSASVAAAAGAACFPAGDILATTPKPGNQGQVASFRAPARSSSGAWGGEACAKSFQSGSVSARGKSLPHVPETRRGIEVFETAVRPIRYSSLVLPGAVPRDASTRPGGVKKYISAVKNKCGELFTSSKKGKGRP